MTLPKSVVVVACLLALAVFALREEDDVDEQALSVDTTEVRESVDEQSADEQAMSIDSEGVQSYASRSLDQHTANTSWLGEPCCCCATVTTEVKVKTGNTWGKKIFEGFYCCMTDKGRMFQDDGDCETDAPNDATALLNGRQHTLPAKLKYFKRKDLPVTMKEGGFNKLYTMNNRCGTAKCANNVVERWWAINGKIRSGEMGKDAEEVSDVFGKALKAAQTAQAAEEYHRRN